MRKRFMVFDRASAPLFDLDLDMMCGEGAVRYEKLNGEHKLDITTTQRLEEGMRILSKDGTGKWREHVIDEPADEHEDGYLATYGCTWSMQYDLSTEKGGELWPGTYEPITAGAALSMVLGNDSAWEVGTVTVSGTAGTSLYDGNRWEYLGKLQEVWGGEMEPRITVDANGVTHRYVDWLAHVGSTEAKRRFDYGEDCTRINRKEAPGPRYCRVIPRGGKDATDNDGVSYSDRVGVDEEPYSSGDGWEHPAYAEYIRDPEAEANFRVPKRNGGWHYPAKVVIYDYDDPEELLAAAAAEIHEHTRPATTYEADVLQFAAAGMDPHGVALGDEVQIVDREYGDAPLRLEARIVEMTVNELDETDVQLVIGEANKGIEAAFKSMRSAIDSAEDRMRRIEGAGTIVYLQHLLDELNAEINGTGGYSYVVAGEGIVTYDKAVADPLIGTEATKVVQIKGGSVRIADSKKAGFSGIADWNWKTVFVSGHIAAELVTAAAITAGFIGNSNSGSYWNLDNNELRIATGAQIGGTTVGDLLQDVASAGVNKIEYGVSSSSSTAPTSWSTTVPSSVAKGSWLWIRTTYKDGGTSTIKAYAGTDGQNGADGADGQSGEDGIGIASVTPQYYLSTSSSSATGGSWSSNPPTWSANHYIWTRSLITWDTTPSTTSTTTEVYDAALTQANSTAAQAVSDAADAAKVATNYLTFNSTNGLDVGYSGTSAKTRINGNGVEIFDSAGNSALFAGIENSKSIVRVGKASNSGNVVMSSDGYVDIRNASTVMAHFGYGSGKNASGGTSTTPYYDIGIRKSGTTVGNYSVAEGYFTTASNFSSHAEGQRTTASGSSSHAEGYYATASGFSSHAEGNTCTASADYSHAEGQSTIASGDASHAEGYYTEANAGKSHAGGDTSEANGICSFAHGDHAQTSCPDSVAFGKYNLSNGSKTTISDYDYILMIGRGNTQSGRANSVYFTRGGNLWLRGTLTQNSDRRLKEHHAYLAEDAADFIRKLRPALYTKDGERHVGFYAQNVQEAEPDEWDTDTVTAQHTDESLDFDPLTLDYSALIAPLVAYAQQLEKRIDEQQKQIDKLIERLDALEGRS